MSKAKVGNFVVLLEDLAYGCQRVERGTICKVRKELDETHVSLDICRSGSETRNSNINKFRLPENEEEKLKLESLFSASTSWSYASAE